MMSLSLLASRTVVYNGNVLTETGVTSCQTDGDTGLGASVILAVLLSMATVAVGVLVYLILRKR